MSFDDTLFSRRLFLTRGVQLLSAAGTLPLFLDRGARCLAADFAANPQGVGRPGHRVLVVVQLAGGNDGLNTVVPVTNDDYYRVRRTLAVGKKSALRLTDDFGLHPAAGKLRKLWDDGRMACLHAVGYPNPNRSHFRSTDIWATADAETLGRTGWLGRYFDACCNGEDPGPQAKDLLTKATDPAAGIALEGDPPMALVGRDYLPIVFRSPDDLAHAESSRDERLNAPFEKLNDVNPDEMTEAPGAKIRIPRGTNGSGAPQQPAERDDASDFLQRSALNARVYAETIRKTASAVQNKATYPASGFANQLKLTAQMIAAGLPTRVFYVQLGGFDTHSGQAPRHVRLLEELSGGLAAFVEDLKALGHLDRTTVMTFSEFGRRVAENDSAGTDHGEAAPMFVFGSSVKPGFHGTPPELSPAKLSRGDVRWSLDFRRVYATVLKQWLGADDVKVLGRRFEPVGLFQKVR